MSTTLTIDRSGGLFLPPDVLESAHFPRRGDIAVDVSEDQILLKAAKPEREVRVIQKDGRLVIADAPPLTDSEVDRAVIRTI